MFTVKTYPTLSDALVNVSLTPLELQDSMDSKIETLLLSMR